MPNDKLASIVAKIHASSSKDVVLLVLEIMGLSDSEKEQLTQMLQNPDTTSPLQAEAGRDNPGPGVGT